ncbi:MAG: C40 family peptidase [Desulfovibrio sp.]|jgi:cell wall-associated NlpC family hydrolase|nr:C40 family peptidase [Desulfovibrio sp.]
MLTRKSGSGGIKFPLLLVMGLFLVLSAGCSLRSGLPDPDGSASGREISKTALSVVGAPYKPGGNDPKSGLDCSGLVCWSYAKHGIKLPRTTSEQSRLGTSVSGSDLKPGDILFFRIKGSLHTGIYTGSGKFVHSPGQGKRVRVDQINSDYWKSSFVSARRLRKIY